MHCGYFQHIIVQEFNETVIVCYAWTVQLHYDYIKKFMTIIVIYKNHVN